MIGKISGTVDDINEDHVIIMAAGVGYLVFCAANTLRNLPTRGETATLFIETHVREDHIHLYGFATAEEKQSFLTLTKISGVGAKMGLAILSTLSTQDISTAIAAQDKSAFTSVSGVGPKLAARLLTELKDKFDFGATAPVISTAGTASGTSAANNAINDAITALVGLGYSRSDAHQTIHSVAANNNDLPVSDLIREGLKALNS